MADDTFRYCLNTSTIRGQGLGLIEAIRMAASAGYDGIEPWVRELDAHLAESGSLAEVRSAADEAGIAVENLIGFFEWAVDDDDRRRAGMEEARRCMDMAAQVGCTRIAAPPMSMTGVQTVDLRPVADRYRKLLDVGREVGVVPVLEFWGISQTLGRLSEAVFVALESGRADACVLADVFHMYKGGSPFESLRLVGPHTIGLFHINDFPAQPGRDAAKDSDRVYPGDGVAPLGGILRDLHAAGFRGPLSLELFNETYWQHEALDVARTGLEKMRLATEQALRHGRDQ
jgi:2-keto-myo-inositol isomerase